MSGAKATALLDALEASWPPATVEARDGWRLRAAPGAGRRVNSARPQQPGAGATAATLATIEAFYAKRGADALLQMDAAAAAEALVERGYAPEAETALLQGPLDDAPPRKSADVMEVRVRLAALDDLWSAGGVDQPRRDVMARADARSSTPLVARLGVELAGAGFVSVVNEIAFIHAIFVVEGKRRRGVAAALIAKGAAYGRRKGARAFAAAVMTENEAALRIFQRRGFETVASYRYFRKPIDVGAS